ncbi:hypothetical protein [Cohaesibacter gelatinilyticus]|uniref:Uncharacterized protein n=1 Tax=Cohaesibacter gelatinilyticus TaxID=372072 RepID=A0A285PEA6_9HYPH|nr:hypothetical protein [Cohaesibacter gelatinilyticus]SNZ20084.1 hypothetical protein SAMN06265368_3183 [Cohaesibacter gelatinilyticus]
MKNLSLTIKGVSVGDTWLRMILADLSDTFSRDDLLCQMTKQPWPDLMLNEAARPILQHLKRQGVISYSRDQKCWQKTSTQEPAPCQIPLLDTDSSVSLPNEELVERVADKSWLAMIAAWLVSACLVGALMIINAGFAWNLTEDSTFRLAFTIGFMGLDGLRPMLMALALSRSIRASRPARILALFIALGLAPASVISSMSVISSALILGTETQIDQSVRQRQLVRLQAELERLESRASQTWAQHVRECDRGGCGVIAEKLKEEAQDLEVRIKEVRGQLSKLETSRPASTFASRTVKTLQAFGLHGYDTEWLMPVFLALTLEIAALFGPALLLGVQSRFRPNSSAKYIRSGQNR